MVASLALLGLLTVADAGTSGRPDGAGKAPEVVPGVSDNYRSLRVLERYPFKVWLAERFDHKILVLSVSSDDPQHPKHSIELDGHPAGLLAQISIAKAKVTVAPIAGFNDNLFLVKLFGDNPEQPEQIVERMQYVIRRAKASRLEKEGMSVACQFPGDATILVTGRSPLSFRVTPDEKAIQVGGVPIQYEMTAAGIIPGSPSCKILAPLYDESASAFEYEATLSLANMLSMKNELFRAGQTRQGLLHMRPHSKNAENIALLTIRELSSFFDGGCSFAPPGTKPLPIPGDLVPLFRAYDDYTTLFPKGIRAPSALYQKASRLSECRHHREAADLYDAIVRRYPDHELAPYARGLREEEMEAATKQVAPSDVRGRVPLPNKPLQQTGSPQ
jgi:hypothetical protein